MKNLMKLCCVLCVGFLLVACSQASEPETTTPEPQEDETEETTEPETTGETLVAYFSWSGNTEAVANMIHSEVGGDIFEIEPATPYTDDYNTLLDVARDEQNANARPALAAQVEDMDQYDTIYLGYPNWWGGTPMVILSFLDSYDFNGKTIIPFCTSGGSGFGSGITSITNSASGATIVPGIEILDDNMSGAQEAVSSWLAS